jgi:hypothetical protein
MNLRMIPLDFTRDGKPRDGLLHAAACAFYKKEFGEEPNFAGYGKAWVVVQDSKDVLGLAGMTSIVDVPLFHVTPPTMDKEGMKIAQAVRDIATWRLHAHLEDVGLRGSTVLIYVSPKTERFWRKYLAKIKAEPAHRYSLII